MSWRFRLLLIFSKCLPRYAPTYYMWIDSTGKFGSEVGPPCNQMMYISLDIPTVESGKRNNANLNDGQSSTDTEHIAVLAKCKSIRSLCIKPEPRVAWATALQA
jgi:hypothetical protein